MGHRAVLPLIAALALAGCAPEAAEQTDLRADALLEKTGARKLDACHCNMCRTWGGGRLMAVNCGSDVRFEGGENITRFASSDWAERGFCKQCGTHLFYRLVANDFHAVPVGLLDAVDGLTFHEQIFVDEKPAFYDFANETENLTGAEVFAKFAPPE